ncbi:dihydrofolate reductase [Paraburkholderia sp. Se-20369]|nr:dihydrofolate reductase [Paraburkholderia sp. Se-20369]TCW80190.1 dihydrofolate reductase [Burkholderia sp. SRS-46]
MSKLVYYVAATMDGYIATQQHTLDWLENFPLGDDATPYDDFYRGIGAVIMGGGTYQWIVANSAGDWPYKDVPAFILTRRDLPVSPGLNIVLRQGSAHAIAAEATRAAGGKDVWVVGGGKTAAFFADAGELQQLVVTTVPVFIGAGIAMLPVSRNVSVHPTSQRVLKSGAMESVLDIRRN